MPLSLHEASVAVMVHMLGQLSTILEEGQRAGIVADRGGVVIQGGVNAIDGGVAAGRDISGNIPSWQMISPSLQPYGPSITGIPRSPGSHGSTGTQGWSLR